MEPGVGSEEEEEVSRTGTMSKDEAEWLLRVLPVLEADRRLKDMVSSSLVDWASRTTWKTHITTEIMQRLSGLVSLWILTCAELAVSS